ncbi:MAG: hypothetical protein ACHQZR_01775 [Candidatus Limnocylindrales bacterium]
MTDADAAWTILQQALPKGWRVREPTFDPDGHVWSVWAVPPAPIRVLPVRGGGPTEAAAMVDLATKLRDRVGGAHVAT